MKIFSNFIEIIDLLKKFGKTTALNNVNARIPKGINLLIGGNGAGKSTLVSIMEGLVSPSRGNILINGLNCTQQSFDVLKHGTFIPERPVVFNSGKVAEFLYWYSKFKGVTSEDIMDMVGLFRADNLLDKEFGRLSMGESELIQIIAALSVDSDFYILDEPNSNLDISRRIVLAEKISEINRKNGSDFLVTSHIIDELLPLAHNLIFLKRGEFKNIETVEDIVKYRREEVIIYTSDPGMVKNELVKLNYKDITIAYNENKIIIRGKNARIVLRGLSENLFNSLLSIRVLPDIQSFVADSEPEE